MGRVFNYLCTALVVFFLSACTKQLSLYKCGEFMCSDGAIIRWNQSSVEFAFDSSVPEALRNTMTDASTSYDAVILDTKILIDPSNISAPHYKSDYASLNEDSINSIYYVSGEWPWTTKIPGSLAVTLTRYSNDGIIEADVFIKENAIGDPSKANATSTYYYKYLCAHELGHALGRSHSTNTESLMYPSINFNQKIDTANSGIRGFFSLFDLQIFDEAYSVKPSI